MNDANSAVEHGHHKLFPPSASKRWLTCTASPLPVSRVYEGDPGYYAVEGNVAHAIFAELMDPANDSMTPSFELGKHYTLPKGGDTVVLFDKGNKLHRHAVPFDVDMAAHLTEARDYVLDLGPGTTLVEQRVECPTITTNQSSPTIVDGTADVLHVTDAEPWLLHVIDLKYGKGNKVEARENTQMRIYGIGSAHTHGMLFDGLEAVETHVAQPRLSHYDSERLTLDNLSKWWATEVVPAVVEALEGGEYRPSEDACKWCPLKADCEALARFAESTVAETFPDLDADPPSKETLATKAEVKPRSDLVRIRRRAKLITMWLGAVEEKLYTLAMTGEPVEGTKLVKGKKGDRTWASTEPADQGIADAVMFALVEADVDDPTPWQPKKLKSPTTVEKELGKAVFAANEVLVASVTRKPEGKPVLVFEEDPRPAFDPTADAASAFADETDPLA